MANPSLGEARADARAILRSSIAAADPEPLVEAHLDVGPGGGVEVAGEPADPDRVRLAAIGKAAPGMARALAAAFPGTPGVCAAPRAVLDAEGAGPAPGSWQVVPGGHPLPDRGSLAAGEALLEAARGTPPEGTLVVGVSGGGSACAEVPRVPLEDLRRVTAGLLEAGAGIGDLNAVRRALSDLKGGGLVRACEGKVVGLVLSDVVGDRLVDVASGPTVPAPRDPDRARAVLEEAGLWEEVPEAVRSELAGGGGDPGREDEDAGAEGVRDRLVGGGDEAGDGGAGGDEAGPGERARNRLVGGNAVARRGAAEAARARGYRVAEREAPLEGEARAVGADLVVEARERAGSRERPLALVAGGETTVTVAGEGRGGPCQELALGAARACAGEEMVVGCIATDGVDGPTGAAGGVVDGGTTRRGREAGWDVEEALVRNDAGGFLEAVGGLLRTGPTGTNVNDVAVVLIP